jgi:diaminopimelate decarboxylase
MIDSPESILKAAAEILNRQSPELPADEIASFVKNFLNRRVEFLELAKKLGSPLYVLEPDILLERAKQFYEAFSKEIPDIKVYFAVKSNNCPDIAGTLVKAGLGLDVSSGEELKLAIDCNASDIIFSGPGKTDPELALAAAYRDRVTILIDSFGEIERLGRISRDLQSPLRAGVRLTTDERGLWRKFGIPLSELPRFISAVRSFDNISLKGLQFHTSWNMGPENQVAFIRQIGNVLRNLSRQHRAMIEFIDIGGGFWPPAGEWLQSAGTPEGRLRHIALPSTQMEKHHYRFPALPINDFALRIGHAVREHIFPFVNCRICAEPGRWICNDAMHILLTVVDKKGDDIIITDAGTNAIGWERFEVDYSPVINISSPETVERQSYILGSLCTPHDVWGYGYWGSGIKQGDILLIPSQGAYTYSLK